MTNKEIETLKWAVAEIRKRMEEGFFGDLNFRFQAGRIEKGEVKEFIKPPN